MAVGSLTVTPEEMDELAGRVIHLLRHEWGDISPDEHSEDHRWTKAQRELQQVRKDRNEAVIRAAVQWSVVGILTAIAATIVSWWKGNHGG